jgi:hypothetical protein
MRGCDHWLAESALENAVLYSAIVLLALNGKAAPKSLDAALPSVFCFQPSVAGASATPLSTVLKIRDGSR